MHLALGGRKTIPFKRRICQAQQCLSDNLAILLPAGIRERLLIVLVRLVQFSQGVAAHPQQQEHAPREMFVAIDETTCIGFQQGWPGLTKSSRVHLRRSNDKEADATKHTGTAILLLVRELGKSLLRVLHRVRKHTFPPGTQRVECSDQAEKWKLTTVSPALLGHAQQHFHSLPARSGHGGIFLEQLERKRSEPAKHRVRAQYHLRHRREPATQRVWFRDLSMRVGMLDQQGSTFKVMSSQSHLYGLSCHRVLLVPVACTQRERSQCLFAEVSRCFTA